MTAAVVTVWLALFSHPQSDKWDVVPQVFKTSEECDEFVNNIVQSTHIVDIACEQVKITVPRHD